MTSSDRRVTENAQHAPEEPMCSHTPACPGADAPDREAAHTIATHPEQGWSLLCNGIVLFEDTGELLPNGQVIAPHRPTDTHPEAFGLIAS
jgi:hypothetical protein